MPVPPSYVQPLSLSHGKEPAWAKLALWAQHRFSRIVYLDLDVVLMKNVDHMVHMPADTFTPEVCSFPPCLPDKIPAGINVGVMVIGPSRPRYRLLLEYMRRREADLLAVADNATNYYKLGRVILGSAEQSFIREFFSDILNASISEPVPQRRGWAWDTQSFESLTLCASRKFHRRDTTCNPGVVHVMSRLYNARPADCHRCTREGSNVPWQPDNYSAYDPYIVHYACNPKPWDRTRADWARRSWCRQGADSPICQPCMSDWVQRWFQAEDRMCDRLLALALADRTLRDVAKAHSLIKPCILRLNQTKVIPKP